MNDTKENTSILNESMNLKLERNSSVLSGSSSQNLCLSIRNQEIIKKLQKFNNISQSVDISSLTKNPLNMIEYEMQGQKSRHDPQMVLAKLRKLQNQAELHRASNEINLLDQQKRNKPSKTQRFLSSRAKNTSQKNEIKLNYMKIYQSYLKQKQTERENRQRYEDEEIQIREDEDFDETKNGIKYFNSLKKHPKLLDHTLFRKNAKQGIIQREIQTERKHSLTKAIKQNKDINEYDEEKVIYRQKEAGNYFQNPEQIIQRQITKFYLKKNPGSLSSETEKNQRSMNLIKKQKQISFEIDDEKISKEDKKRLKHRFNELVNQLARSDRRNSLQRILPKIKESQTLKMIHLKDGMKKKLFDNK